MNLEALVIGWLAKQPELEGVPVVAEVPVDRPKRFVTVERVGGGNREFVDRASLAVQAWAGSRFDAATLADTVRVVVGMLPTVEQVARVDVGSVYNWPDPDSRQSRYQITVDVSVKWNHP